MGGRRSLCWPLEEEDKDHDEDEDQSDGYADEQDEDDAPELVQSQLVVVNRGGRLASVRLSSRSGPLVPARTGSLLQSKKCRLPALSLIKPRSQPLLARATRDS